MPQGPNIECESTGPLWARRRAGKGPGPGRPPCRRTIHPLGATLGGWLERKRLRAIRCEGRGSLRAMRGEGETSAGGRGRSHRSDPGWWSRRPWPITERGGGGASKPGGKDGAAVEVTAEVGASKPITAGDVAGRAGCGQGRASVPITAGRGQGVRAGNGRGRGAPCAGEPAQEPLFGEERGGAASVLRAG